MSFTTSPSPKRARTSSEPKSEPSPAPQYSTNTPTDSDSVPYRSSYSHTEKNTSPANEKPPVKEFSGAYYEQLAAKYNADARNIKHCADKVTSANDKSDLYLKAALKYLHSLHYQEVSY